MSDNLWPKFPAEQNPRGMSQMLKEAGDGIRDATDGAIEFRVKTYPDGDRVYHDCYLVVSRVKYPYLLLRVTTGVAPFPAAVVTPNGQQFSDISNEVGLREFLKRHFHSKEIQELVENLLGTFAGVEPVA